MSWRFVCLVCFWMLACLPLKASEKSRQSSIANSKHAALLDRLVAAYPDFLRGHDGTRVIWHDGSVMAFEDGKSGKSFERRLKDPDLQDQFFAPYKKGHNGLSPAKNQDPGRVRYQPFFNKMYGDCRKRQVRDQLQTIVWLPRHGGTKVKVTSINGVAGKLQKISHELDLLIDQRPEIKKYLSPMSGIYNCRLIAGTKRYSVHAYGAAIDINVKQAHYWRWSKPGKGGLYRWRNKIPLEIVKVFENHGFIWGGKWYHYDTMHFEYRPELLSGAQ